MEITRKPSLWWKGAPPSVYPRLDRSLSVDVAIVGGGITGLTSALLLARAGHRVALLELGELTSGATGDTTGHLTASLDRPFKEVVAKFGLEGARGAVAASMTAIDFIERTVAELAIECGFARVRGYRFSQFAGALSSLEAEADLAAELGLEVSVVTETPLPFRIEAALRFERQAELSPLAYCQALATEVLRLGGVIFTGTLVDAVTSGEPCQVHALGHVVSADAVIMATHTPLGRVLTLQSRLSAFTSYVLAFGLGRQPAPEGLFWDTEAPYHYVRRVQHRGQELLMIGGEDHRTGQEPDTQARFSALESYARHRFDLQAVEARWSGEYFEPADGLPYIGRLAGTARIYVATGFSGTGLTFGTAAALLIADLVRDVANPWAALFSPTRVKALASVKAAVMSNVNAAWRWATDRLRPVDKASLDALPPGQGRLINIGGKKAAVYRDHDGEVHAMSPQCTHLGCVVQWNGSAGSWDCPCHGGRFQATGEVLNGPPTSALAAIEHDPGDSRVLPDPGSDDDEAPRLPEVEKHPLV